MKKSKDWAKYWKVAEETDHGGVIFWNRTTDPAKLENLPMNMNQNDDSLCISEDVILKWYSQEIDSDGNLGDWKEF